MLQRSTSVMTWSWGGQWLLTTYSGLQLSLIMEIQMWWGCSGKGYFFSLPIFARLCVVYFGSSGLRHKTERAEERSCWFVFCFFFTNVRPSLCLGLFICTTSQLHNSLSLQSFVGSPANPTLTAAERFLRPVMYYAVHYLRVLQICHYALSRRSRHMVSSDYVTQCTSQL